MIRTTNNPSFIRRLWRAMTIGERILAVCTVTSYVVFPITAVIGVLTHDARLAILPWALATALTVALVYSLKSPKGRVF